MEFNDRSGLISWKGNTPVAKLQNDRCEAYGSTNFQSIAETFGSILREGVKESDFPSGILCVSDGCFNSVGNNKSNFKELKRRLSAYGFSKEYVENLS